MTASYINTECKRYGCIKNLLACYANCRYSGRCDELKNELMDKSEQAARDINSYLSERGREPITIQIQKRGVKFLEASKVWPKPEPRVRIASSANLGTRPGTRPRRKTIKRRRADEMAASLDAVSLNRDSRPKRKTGPAKPTTQMETLSAEATGKRKAGTRKSRAKKRASQGKETIMPKRNARPSGAGANRKELNLTASAEGQNAAQKKSARSKSTSAQKRRSGAQTSSRSRKSKVFIILEGDRATLVDERGLMSHLLSGNNTKARYFEASEVEARVQIIAKK